VASAVAFFPEGVIYKKPTSDILPRCFLLGFKISQSGPGLGHLAGRREPAEDGKAQAFAQTHGIVQGGLDYLEIIASSDQAAKTFSGKNWLYRRAARPIDQNQTDEIFCSFS
jgi:hypothetical protein